MSGHQSVSQGAEFLERKKTICYSAPFALFFLHLAHSFVSSTHLHASLPNSAEVAPTPAYTATRTLGDAAAVGSTAKIDAANHASAFAAPIAYPASTCGHVWYPSATLSQVKNIPVETKPAAIKGTAQTGTGQAVGLVSIPPPLWRRPAAAYVERYARLTAWLLGMPGSAFAAPVGRAWFKRRFRSLPAMELTTEPIRHHATGTLGWVTSVASAAPATTTGWTR